MTPNQIITAVRSRLGDSKKERWDEDTLLLYVSLCQNDICIFTRFNRKTTTLPIVDGTLVYDLPTDCLAVNRVEYNCEVIPMESRNTIDSKKAEFPCILKDNVQFNQLEFVLDQEDSNNLLVSALTEIYGVVTDSDSDAIDTSSCELDDVHGVVSDVDCDTTGTAAACSTELMVYYTAVPALITSSDMDKDILLPDIWFQAFLHFVGGMALQDDNDANNIQRGELEAQKYTRMLAHIQKIAAKDFTSNIPSKLTTDIRRI